MKISARLEQAQPKLWPYLLALLALGGMTLAAAALYVSSGRAETVENVPPPQPVPVKPVETKPAAPPKVQEQRLAQFEPKNLQLKKDERLEYDIKWNGMPAGRARFRVKSKGPFLGDGPEVWTVQLEVRSNRVVNAFYPVNDRTRSMIDVVGGFSRFYLQELDEGDYENRERISFDYAMDRLNASYEHDRGKENWRASNIALPGKVLDPLSALYYLRATNLNLNTPVTLPVCAERKVWNVTLAPVGREAIEVKAFKTPVQCLVVSMEFEFNGLFVRKGPMKVWLDEKTKIPMKIETELPIGPCEILLADHEDSVYDLPADKKE